MTDAELEEVKAELAGYDGDGPEDVEPVEQTAEVMPDGDGE